jgi:uncharacterized protein (DUF2336 family)
LDSAALIEELNEAVVRGTASQRAEILHRITDLFALASANYSADQVELFHQILMRIATTIEVSARAMLAERLANDARAPRKISRFLASHDAIDVAGPMLERSQQLDRYTLLESSVWRPSPVCVPQSRGRSSNSATTRTPASAGRGRDSAETHFFC